MLSIHIGGALSKLCCWSVEPSTGGQSIAGSVVAVVSSGEVEFSVAADVLPATSSLEHAAKRCNADNETESNKDQRSPLRCASSSVVNALLTKLSYLTSGLICFFAFAFCGSHGCEGYRHLRSRSHVRCRRRRWLDADQLTWPGPSENSRTSAALKGSKSCPGRTRPPTR